MAKYSRLMFSVLFLFLSLAIYQNTLERFQTEATTTTDSPVGVWHQYVENNGRNFYLGTYRFTEKNGDYSIEVLDISPHAFPQKGLRTFGHDFKGDRWSFYSDWKEHGTAHFQLMRVGPGHYSGYAALSGVSRPYTHHLVKSD